MYMSSIFHLYLILFFHIYLLVFKIKILLVILYMQKFSIVKNKNPDIENIWTNNDNF